MSTRRFKLFQKLIEAAGGWESFLYQTLSDFYKEMVSKSEPRLTRPMGDILEEVKEVLGAYEETLRTRNVDRSEEEKPEVISKSVAKRMAIQSQEEQIPSDQVEQVAEGADQVETDVKKAIKPAIMPEGDGEKEISRVTASLPLEGPEPKPTSSRAVVRVDPPVGDCQGNLPISPNHKIVNRDKIEIMTMGGIVLAKGKEDGQIKDSNHVKGYIRTSGRYDLVFGKVDIGQALIVYEVVKVRCPKVVELEMVSSQDLATREWISYTRDPELVARANTLKDSKDHILDALKREYNMQIVSVTTLRRIDAGGRDIVPAKPIVM